MEINIQIFDSKINALSSAAVTAQEMAAEYLHTEVVQAQVMPRDTGNLQNESTFVDTTHASEGSVALVSSTPYARRLYFHPEYHFKKDENPNAKGRWLADWLPGGSKDYLISDAFAHFYKELTGV